MCLNSAGYTVKMKFKLGENQVRPTLFFKFDFSKIIYRLILFVIYFSELKLQLRKPAHPWSEMKCWMRQKPWSEFQNMTTLSIFKVRLIKYKVSPGLSMRELKEYCYIHDIFNE